MDRRTRAILFLAILFLALSFRMAGLERSFILDEFRTIKFAGLNSGELLEALKGESYPPLFYVFLSAWLGISRNETWIRLLPVIFGLFSVIAVYLIGRMAGGDRYAFLAMFFMALMPIQVWASQYVRGISCAIFFILLATFFFLRLTREKELKVLGPNLLGYAASAILSIYSFYFIFFVIAAQNLIYIFKNRNNIKNVFKWLAAQLLIAASFLPWAGIFMEQLRGANILMNFSLTYPAGFRIAGLPLGIYMRCAAGLAGMDQAFMVQVPIAKLAGPKMLIAAMIIFFLAAVSVIWGLAVFYKRLSEEKGMTDDQLTGREMLTYFSLFAGLPVISSLALNILFKTPLALRYFAVSSVFVVFIYALIMLSIKDKRTFFIIIVLFISVSVLRLADFSKADIDYKNAALFLNSNIKDNECVLFTGGESAYRYYCPLPKHYIDSEDYMRKYEPSIGHSPEHMVNADALRKCLKPFKSVWVYQSGEKMSGTAEYILRLLERFGYTMTSENKFKNIPVFRYTRNG